MSALNYPNLAPNAAVYGEGKFLVELDSYFNDGYIIHFTLTVNSAQGTFVSAFNLPVRSGQTEVTDAEFATGVLQPGETDDLTVTLRNIGQMSLTGVTAVLSSDDEQITIIDNQGTFGDIAAGQAVNNSGDTFSIQADALATEGHRVLLNMRLTSAEGCEQDLLFEIILGQISADDPIGPDDYGYYCVDNADVEYSGHPVFDWVEIRNIGTPINLPDFGNSQDVSTYVHLPFDFTFYGVTSDTLTVCSNGWLALGNQAYFSDFRNYPMPSAAGANAGMICPLWDDLVRGNGDVYYWNDTANHRFIIEYCNVAYMYGAGILKFEIILYDPAFYPTPTGDGEMVFQYHTFQINQGPSSDNLYWTTGIENHNHTIGLQYAYWNVYTPGASIIASGRAVKFTTNEPLRTPQPETVEITLEPINPPIQIPAVGGAFQYGLLLYNSGTQTTVFDTWIMLTLPDSSMVGPLLLRQNLSLAQGDSLQRTMTQNVPGAALPGEYIYTAKTGDYSLNAIWDSSYFNFTKLGADASSGGEWQLIGWDNITASSAAIPLKYELNDAHPNPFNPLTDINFTLPKSGRVTLTVFNTLGQKVAALKDSWCEAGGHSITFDGRQLASGIYFYNLKADDFSQTKKMLLMK